jgi:hypothetical protein
MPYQIENAIPGLSGLTRSATGIIQNALNGMPSPNNARLANAYFGAGSGLDPTSDFLRNRGYDLYRNEANQRQRQGFQDLLSLVGGYSGTVAPTPAQEVGAQQNQQQINNQASQFGQSLGFERQQYDKQLELLTKYLGPGGGSNYGNVGAAASFGQGGNPLDAYGNPLNQGDYAQSMFIANGGLNRAPTTNRFRGSTVSMY